MTLIVAAVTDDGTWIAGDRIAGGMDYKLLAGPKVFRLTAGEVPFSIGFAGSPRVAQLAVSATPPPYDPTERSLRWWLTEMCNRIGERCSDLWALSTDDDGAGLCGRSGALLCIDGRVILIGNDLSWEEPARGFHAIGVAFETFLGAWSTNMGYGHDVVTAARQSWPIAQRFHRIGPIADEIVL